MHGDRKWILACAGPLVLLAGGVLGAWAPAEGASSNAGFLYGEVTTRSGKEYRGFLRWGTEESFWDDLFHSAKADLPYLEDLPESERERSRRRSIRIFGHEISNEEARGSRVFICRFGDIAEIEVLRDERALVHLKNKDAIEVHGYSNDVSGSVQVDDADAGKITVEWDRIERIRFSPPPAAADPGVTRLFGKVETSAGIFEGFVQWDKQECTSADILNGESEDGKMEIPMGRIRSIERQSRRSSRVELSDGRVLRLEGTNDVNDENRGIMVEDRRFGRVTIPWEVFDKITFSTAKGSGRGYGEYPALGPLEGSVTGKDGDKHQGRIVFDTDEEAGWEMLNGSNRDVDYDIPFALVASIERLDAGECRVALRSGEQVVLEDSQDVTDKNAGILVFTGGDKSRTYLSWSDVSRLDFNR